jgi:hypothetical protein
MVSTPTSGPNAGALVLSGNLTAVDDGEIDYVNTMLITCTPNTPASTCLGSPNTGDPVTEKPLQAAPDGCPPNTPCQVRLRAGQILQVTVVISFS